MTQTTLDVFLKQAKENTDNQPPLTFEEADRIFEEMDKLHELPELAIPSEQNTVIEGNSDTFSITKKPNNCGDDSNSNQKSTILIPNRGVSK
ncbi:hypothetical protein DRZ78_02020 [Candidatus Aerophobetes bacterium]|uniref:Uncharacterized protein n=1 Tax=Aerophobetes bacterium TaxID=2030807 RepID=A0A662D3A2_UNCAE|nr:MAG: hypothetical protein DRZ78_02020 [Candidatus Aerophobetes bacterium]